MEHNTEANVVRVAVRAHRAPGGGRIRLLAYVHTNCACRLASTLVGQFDNLPEAEALAAGATPEHFRHCTKSTPIREQAPAVEAEAPAVEHQAEPTRDEPSDFWTITNRDGVEIARVEGATAEDMTRAVEALPKVRATMRREGGFTRRRLWVSELTPADTEQTPTGTEREQQPAAEVERRVVEGVVVGHAGTTEGSLPKHSAHTDVIAARDALRPLKPATLADHTDTSHRAAHVDTSVRGYMLVPRQQGRVAAYWIEGGQDTFRGQPHTVELEILRQKFLDAGWRVEPKSRTCVFAWRPTEGSTGQADEARQEAGRALRARRRQTQQPAPAEPASGFLVDPWTWLRRSYATHTTAPAAVEAPAECSTHDEADAVAELPAVADVEQDVVDEPEAGGTWRSGWMTAEQRVTEGALFDLGNGAEQGMLFE